MNLASAMDLHGLQEALNTSLSQCWGVTYWLVRSVSCPASSRIFSPRFLGQVVHLLLLLPCVLSPEDAHNCWRQRQQLLQCSLSNSQTQSACLAADKRAYCLTRAFLVASRCALGSHSQQQEQRKKMQHLRMYFRMPLASVTSASICSSI